MGYTTDFSGSFKLNKPLDVKTHKLLTELANTRRMKRDAAKLKEKYNQDFGVEGEFFTGGDGFKGQGNYGFVLEHNSPPKTQPSLWCQWIPNEDGTEIEWDGGEKFYYYVEWIEYIIEKILKPRGFSLTGDVQWRGEDFGDIGVIRIIDNEVEAHNGVIHLPEPKKAKSTKKKQGVSK